MHRVRERRATAPTRPTSRRRRRARGTARPAHQRPPAGGAGTRRTCSRSGMTSPNHCSLKCRQSCQEVQLTRLAVVRVDCLSSDSLWNTTCGRSSAPSPRRPAIVRRSSGASGGRRSPSSTTGRPVSSNVLAANGIGAHTPRSALQPWELGQHTVGLYMLNCPEYLEATLGGFAARTAPFNVNSVVSASITPAQNATAAAGWRGAEAARRSRPDASNVGRSTPAIRCARFPASDTPRGDAQRREQAVQSHPNSGDRRRLHVLVPGQIDQHIQILTVDRGFDGILSACSVRHADRRPSGGHCHTSPRRRSRLSQPSPAQTHPGCQLGVHEPICGRLEVTTGRLHSGP